MTESQILERVKKGIDLYTDKTFELKDLYGHMLQIIKECAADEQIHKQRLEKLLYDIDVLQENQSMYWDGHKDKLPICKQLEKELRAKKQNLLRMGGYDIMQFKLKAQQGKLL